MPFLRSLEAVDSSHELRSSKTLIGSGKTTCDVVITGDNVLDLHALLDLSADKTSATLVPFSTTEAGACYVNDVLVPRDGAVVVHGDRVAFGDPRNAFLFELTPHPQMTQLQQSIGTENSMQYTNGQTTATGDSRAFRRALDALRGDRKVSNPNASVVASIQNNLATQNENSFASSAFSTAPSMKSKDQPRLAQNQNSFASSAYSTAPSMKSKDQLSKFLSEASTDSLLSDYVERKLKQRRSASSSVTSSNPRRSRVSYNTMRQSREERNIAEVEKLRLSQRIREVNDVRQICRIKTVVLNGDMEFQDSCLSPSSKSSRSHRSSRWTLDNKLPRARDSLENDEGSKEDEDEEDEDELPSMMERPTSARVVPATSLSVSIQTEHSDQENSPSPPNRDEAKEESETLDYSLENVPASEASQVSRPPKARDFFSKAMSLGFNDLTRSQPRPIKTARQEAAKTALHEKLINHTIRRKKNEIMSQAFVRWQRGLRIQRQNRERCVYQLLKANAALGKLRRDHIFFLWRDFAALSSQVMTCRLEAFQHRRESRLVRRCWTAFYLNSISAAYRSKLLRGLIVKRAMMTRLSAFRSWRQLVHNHKARCQLGEVKRIEQRKLDVYLERMSERHFKRRRIQTMLVQVLRDWRTKAARRKKKQKILRRVLVHGTLKLVQRAWRKWVDVARISKFTMTYKKQAEEHIKQTTERLASQHDQAQASAQENHALQLQELMITIENKDKELEQLKRRQRTETLEKAAAKTKWEQHLHSFLENAIGKCDDQIAQASDNLEELLQSAEDDVLSARFGAAQFLVNFMLQQKLHNANECIRLQEIRLSMQPSGKAPEPRPTDQDPASNLSSNGRFLYDMLQQRLTRLQQLHQSLAKLAAVSDDISSTSLDPDRLRHSSFIATALFQRQQTHLLAVLTHFRRLGRSALAH